MAKSHQKFSTGNASQILTDQEIAKLFLSLYRDYQDAKQKHPNNSQAIYDALQMNMCWDFEFGALKIHRNNRQAQQEAYKVLNTFWQARKQDWGTLSDNTCIPLYAFPANMRTLIIINNNSSRYHYCHDNFSDLLLYSAWMSSHQTHAYPSRMSRYPRRTNICAETAVVLLAIGAAIAAAVAVYFITKYLTESIERFSYNEGFFDALTPIAGMLIGGAIAGFASSLLLSGALTTLAIAAGANPVGFSIYMIVSLALIGTAIGGAVAKYSKEHANAKSHANSLNPYDPHRFRLTSSEVTHLEAQNLDPIKVKCAIVALMKTLQTPKVPHLFSRDFRTQDTLDQVRKLRAGKINHLDVQGLSFDLQKDNAMQPPAYAEQQEPGQFHPDFPAHPLRSC